MPAELVLRAVAVSANASAELSDLVDQLLARHLVEVGVH
jgi:hypothetical protein